MSLPPFKVSGLRFQVPAAERELNPWRNFGLVAVRPQTGAGGNQKLATRNQKPPSAAAFTLVELIIVMALLAIVTGIAAPMLGRSMKERNLPDEAKRFLAATEYARSEAVSQGVPMVVWLDLAARQVGIEPRPGFDGEPTRNRTYKLGPDVHMETDQRPTTVNGHINVVEFGPDGAPADTSAEFVKLADRFGYEMNVVRTSDRWSYEIQRPTR